jgi:hypothetical protein
MKLVSEMLYYAFADGYIIPHLLSVTGLGRKENTPSYLFMQKAFSYLTVNVASISLFEGVADLCRLTIVTAGS